MLSFQGELVRSDGTRLSVADDIAEVHSRDRRKLAVEIGRLLRGARSFWPKGETGRSGRAWYVQLRAGGVMAILNRAKNRSGKPYAPIVNAGYPNRRTRNAVGRTIEAGWEAMFERINSADP